MKDRININDIKVSQKYLKLVPRMSKEDDQAFDESVKQDGIRDPLTLNQDLLLLDGHSRYDKAKKYDYQNLPYRIKNFDNKLLEEQYVIECNLQRRHLTNYQKIELGIPLIEIEMKLAKERKLSTLKQNKPIGSNDPNDNKGKTLEIVAKKVGVSYTTMQRGKTITEKAPEHLKEKLRNGKVSVNSIYQHITKEDRNLPKAVMPKGKFDIILCDIPIEFDNKSIRGAANNHYNTMSPKELSELKIPSADNAIMFFWISSANQYTLINNNDVDSYPLYQYILDAWGFTMIKNEFVWNKQSIGVGSWVANQHEKCLIAIKGKMPTPAKLYSSIIDAKRTKHSEKPEIFYDMIEKMYPKRNYLELFARKKHNDNWSVYGNEVKQ